MSSAARGRLATLVVPAIVAIVTVAAFLPALRADFVTWDDDTNFLNNRHYRGLGPSQLHWMWTTFHMGHYVPLSWMTLGLDYLMWGMNPAGYHATNIVFHAANAVAVYFVIRRALSMAFESSADEPRWLAIAAACGSLSFAVHPLRVESVAWITERRDVLSGLLSSLTVLAYLHAVKRPSRAWYRVAVALFASALLSKATVLTLPAVLLILNAYPLRRLGGEAGWWGVDVRRVYLELLPFFALAGAAAAMTFVALQHVDQLSAAQKLAVSSFSLMFYLWKTIVPSGLAPLYTMPQGVDPWASMFVASYVVVGALAILAWRTGRRSTGFAAAAMVFFVTIFPLLGFHQNGPQIAADRYTYHASPVLGVLVAAVLFALPSTRRRPTLAMAGATIALFVVLTWRQTSIWQTSERMWTRVLDMDANASVAHTALANILLRRGDVNGAIVHYERSLAIDPRAPEAHDNYGVALARLGRNAEAIAQYEQTLRIKPDDYEAENDLGVAIAHAGNDPAAIEHYRRAIAINPDYADPHVNWGNALVRGARFAEAIDHYASALAINAENADAQRNWGVALAQQGKLAEAVQHFRRALELAPSDADAKAFYEAATAQLAR